DDLLGAAGHRVEAAVRSEGLAVAFLRILEEGRDLAVEADLVGLAVGYVVVVDLALRVHGGPLGELVAFGDQLPLLARQQDLLQLRRGGAALDGRGPVLPEPAHRAGADRRGLLAVVAVL